MLESNKFFFDKNFFVKSIIILISLIAVVFLINYFAPFFVDESFSVIVLPDIQKYSLKGREDILISQVNWIIENEKELNIKFVVFEGDLVENWDKHSQWIDANQMISKLEEHNIPFLLVPGNHDHDKTNPNLPLTNYNYYFPNSRFENKSWWGGSFGVGNTYQKIRIGFRDYLFLGLDFCPNNDELGWANKIFYENKSNNLILTTHGYLDLNGNRKVHGCSSTENIWSMSKTHKNLQVILSGHVHGEYTRTSMNDFNYPVTQMLADYQALENGGNGYLRILHFSPSEGIVKVRTYSPFLNELKEGKKSNFEFEYNFN
ncbi:MAG: metallophosphoesterase [Candidatus Iainarchaeum sp.]|jgi:DNA repair exonuclease SbcCD nuclease subunit